MYIYELSNEQVSDYVPIKFVLHEVFETSEEYQNNGISWQEPYVSQALSQIEGVSITAELMMKKLKYGVTVEHKTAKVCCNVLMQV